MYEKDMVKQRLQRYMQHEADRIWIKECELLEAAMGKMLDALQQVDSRPLPISANMVIVLHEVLVAESADQIAQLQSKFSNVSPEFIEAAKKLYSLDEENDFYCEALIKLHELFSGRCLRLAESNVSHHSKKLLQFTRKNESSNELTLLQNNEKEAKENFGRIDDFCSRYMLKL